MKKCPCCSQEIEDNTTFCRYCVREIPKEEQPAVLPDFPIETQPTALPEKLVTTPDPVSEIKKCPFCAEDIKYEAIVCRYCGRDIKSSPKLNNKLDQNGIISLKTIGLILAVLFVAGLFPSSLSSRNTVSITSSLYIIQVDR